MTSIDVAAITRLADALRTLLEQAEHSLVANEPKDRVLERVQVALACSRELVALVDVDKVAPRIVVAVDEPDGRH